MSPIPPNELEVEKAPRISGADVLEFGGFLKKQQDLKKKLIIIDVRSPKDFQRGTLPGSINIPATEVVDSGTGLFYGFMDINIKFRDLLRHLFTQGLRPLVFVVLGSMSRPESIEHIRKFSNAAVAAALTKVCILHNGIEAFRSETVVSVPNPRL